MICGYCGKEAELITSKGLEYIIDGVEVHLCKCKVGWVYAIEGLQPRDREYRRRWEDLRGRVTYYSKLYNVRASELWKIMFNGVGYETEAVNVDPIDDLEALETMHVILDHYTTGYRG